MTSADIGKWKANKEKVKEENEKTIGRQTNANSAEQRRSQLKTAEEKLQKKLEGKNG